MKKFLVIAASLLLSGLPAFAQGKTIPFVDIATAKTQVDTLTKENETLAADNVKMKKESEDQRASIATNQKQINDITPILENVRAKGVDLAGILANISDKGMRTNAEQSLSRNKELEKKLVAKIEELEKANAASQKVIANNQKNVDVNETRIQKNKDEIILLQAAISKTEVQQGKLTDYMKDVDAFLNNAESVLKSPAATK